jgi:3-dehydroshikimate dehydratase
MLNGGICSVSYRNSSPDDIIAATVKAGLAGIEWSADTHVPHGNREKAEAVMLATLKARLTVSAYGSFFRLGTDGDASFAEVLASARSLQAPLIRIWAPAAQDSVSTTTLAETGRRLADKSGHYGITLCVEAHERTTLHNYEALGAYIHQVNHPFFRACWSPLPGIGEDEILRQSAPLYPYTALVHVRSWAAGYQRRSLGENTDALGTILSGIRSARSGSELDVWTLIEYLEDETPAVLSREAAILNTLIGQR